MNSSTAESLPSAPVDEREPARNQRLRRADWRFLLPEPAPHTTVCFARGTLATAAAAISQHLVAPAEALPGSCDLAVTADADIRVLREARDQLRPGGAFYGEWYGVWPGWIALRRRVEAAGLSDVRCFWPWPRPDRGMAQWWLPLDAPGVQAYFLASRPPVQRMVERLRRALLRRLWLAAHAAGVVAPVCVVARRPTSPATHGGTDPLGAGPRAIAGLDDAIGTVVPRAPGDVASRLHWLLLTGGRRSINKPVGLVFTNSDVQPRLAIKFARVPEAEPALRREAAVLRALRRSSLRDLVGVPHVLFCGEFGGVLALGETALHGQPLYTQLDPASAPRLACEATDWLIGLAAPPGPVHSAARVAELVEGTLAQFHDMFGAVIDPGMLAATADLLTSLPALPIVCEQRDFSPWNILVTPQGELVVLDWESADLDGLPARDLIYFLSYLAMFLSGAMAHGRMREAYQDTLDPQSLTGALIVECLTRYMQQLGCSTAVIPSLRLLTWMSHARSDYQHIVADVGGPPSPAMLRRSVFLQFWEEEVRYHA